MNCLDCQNHKILPDPDPYDWFCDDDLCVVCVLVGNKGQDTKSEYLSDTYDYRSITRSCRPHYLRKESTCPNWCPLPSEKNKP